MTEFHAHAARRGHLRAVPDAPDAPSTPDQPGRPCPPELRDPGAALRQADLSVPCPHCRMPARTPCVIPGTNRSPAGGTHPSRQDAARGTG